METVNGLLVLHCASSREWDNWLSEHHGQPEGVWLKIAKKGTGAVSVSYDEALDAALCHGWIDGQKKAHDDEFWLQKFTPRRSKSVWSRVNTEKVEQLIAAGRMKPAGQAAIDAAKRDGRWEAAYQPQGGLTVPADLLAALDKHPEARAFFDTLNKPNRYAICYRIETAVKPETRQARIEKFIAMLARHETLHP